MDCLSFGRAFGTHIKTAGPANIADAHGSSYVPYIGGAISGAVKPHPSRNAFRSSMGEGLAGLAGGAKGTLLGAGTSAALNLLTRGKLGLKSNALAGILGGSVGTHMGSQWHREDLPLNARALAEMGRSAVSKKAAYPVLTPWPGRPSGAFPMYGPSDAASLIRPGWSNPAISSRFPQIAAAKDTLRNVIAQTQPGTTVNNLIKAIPDSPDAGAAYSAATKTLADAIKSQRASGTARRLAASTAQSAGNRAPSSLLQSFARVAGKFAADNAASDYAEMGRSAVSKKASGEFNPHSWNQGYNTGTSSANNHNIHALASGGILGGVAGLATEAMREKNEEEKNQSLLRKVLRYVASGGAGAAGGAGAMGALGALTAPGTINLHSKSSAEKVSGLGDMLGAVTKKLPMKPIAAGGKPVASAAPARLSEAAQRQVLQQKIPGMGDAVTFPRKPLPAGRVVDLPEVADGSLKLAKDEKLANFGRFVGAGMNAARNTLGAGSQMAGQAVTGAMNAAKPMVNNALNTAGQAVTSAVNAAKPVLNSATTAVKNTLNTPGRQIAATTAAGVGAGAAAIPVAQHFENKRIDAQVDRQRARLAQPQQPAPKLAFDSTTGAATLVEPQPRTLTGNGPNASMPFGVDLSMKALQQPMTFTGNNPGAAMPLGIDPKKIQESWAKHFDKYGPEGQKPGFVG